VNKDTGARRGESSTRQKKKFAREVTRVN